MPQKKLKKNILLILTTKGGDPDAAYRFSRCLQEAYKLKMMMTNHQVKPKKVISQFLLMDPVKVQEL